MSIMKVSILHEGRNHEIELEEGSSVEHAIKKARISLQTVLARRGNEIVPDTEKLRDKDVIELLKVVSGG